MIFDIDSENSIDLYLNVTYNSNNYSVLIQEFTLEYKYNKKDRGRNA